MLYSRHTSFITLVLISLCSLGLALGCGGGDKPAKPTKGSKGKTPSSVAENDDTDSPAPRKFKPIQLGGNDGTSSAGGDDNPVRKPQANLTGEERTKEIVAALQPFQIMLGKWRWVTNKRFGDSAKSGEDWEWIWDFRSDRNQPALHFTAEKSPYFTKGWLTYLPETAKFHFTGEMADGEKRLFEGNWTDDGEPREVPNESKRPDRTYKVQLTQVEPAEGELWQLTFNQQENNRLLLDFKKRAPAGKNFGPMDVVATQRLGTSFAVADSDNPGPKCVVSGGLGSSSVSYMGKSYPVCCSGCAAAFKDDPERWLAKLAKEQAEKGK